MNFKLPKREQSIVEKIIEENTELKKGIEFLESKLKQYEDFILEMGGTINKSIEARLRDNLTSVDLTYIEIQFSRRIFFYKTETDEVLTKIEKMIFN